MTHASAREVLLQDVRGFSVRILSSDDQTVGTGFVVSRDGKVVTCAHVVRDALGIEARDALGHEIRLRFPANFGLRRDAQSHRAKVVACFPSHDDDVALLQVLEDLPQIGQPAILAAASRSGRQEFLSFGYRRLDDYLGLPAHGVILGFGDPPEDRLLQADPLMLRSENVDRGMSGAAVLDVELNRVVGIIAETWDSAGTSKDRDTAFAVDARVLTLAPLNLPLNAEEPAAEHGPQLHTATPAVRKSLGVDLSRAPEVLSEWVGRRSLLATLEAVWRGSKRRVVGLIGFGGEGKTSLARRWVDEALRRDPAPAGVFWWSFYDNGNLDELWAAAIRYLMSEQVDLGILSSAARAQLVAAALRKANCVLVMDGLEVLQHQAGDRYGQILRTDLRRFLQLCARSGNESLCIVTSRAPLFDLLRYPAYVEHAVDRLSTEEGRALFRSLGVQGPDFKVDALVESWGGHALTLSLLATYIVKSWDGDVRAGEVAHLPAGVPKGELVQRVLRRYDERLSESERTFLTILSAFREPVPAWMIANLLQKSGSKLLDALARQDDSEFEALVERLIEYRLLRKAEEGIFTVHPLVRAHYQKRLKSLRRNQTRSVHRRIKDGYLDQARRQGRMLGVHRPDDLRPALEAVYHACAAGAYDEAFQIFETYAQAGDHLLTTRFGAYDTALSALLDFFANRDPASDPKVTEPPARASLLNQVGFCLKGLGRLAEAVPIFERCIAAEVGIGDLLGAATDSENLASTYVSLGKLDEAWQAATRTLDLARRAKEKTAEYSAMTLQGYIAHLWGDQIAASAAFDRSEEVLREIDPSFQKPFGNGGNLEARHLLRLGDRSRARSIAEANRKMCLQYEWPADYSQCECILGDLDLLTGNRDGALKHYDEALRVAHLISDREVRIDALLARGRWAARQAVAGEEARAQEAGDDLREALSYALEGGYLLHEADIRVGLAWMHLASGRRAAAGAEVERAAAISQETGYHWGRVEAEEIPGQLLGLSP